RARRDPRRSQGDSSMYHEGSHGGWPHIHRGGGDATRPWWIVRKKATPRHRRCPREGRDDRRPGTRDVLHLCRLRRGSSGLHHERRCRRLRARWRRSASSGAEEARAMKGPVRPSLATVLAAAVLASAIVLGGRAAADDTEPEITSWMLPPSTRPVWGLL